MNSKKGKNSQQKKNQKVQGKGKISSVPLAQSRPMRTTVPKVSGSPYSGDGRVRIKHREYIGDINGSVAFSATSYSINPGLSQMFPWLSEIAAQFESYLFRALSFEYETQKSASTSGSVMQAVDFDAADAAPASKQVLMAFHNAVRSAVWEECCYRADAADLKKFGVQRYIRSDGSLAANLDIKTYDVGNLIVATQGETDTTAIGELYVVYDVELITPQISSSSALPNSFEMVMTGASRAAPFTGVQTITGGLPITATGSTLTFNKVGEYLVVFNYITANTCVQQSSIAFSGTATASMITTQFANAALTAGMLDFRVSVNTPGQTVICDLTTTCTTLSACTVRIAPFAYSLA